MCQQYVDWDSSNVSGMCQELESFVNKKLQDDHFKNNYGWMGSMISLLDPGFDVWTVDDNGTVGRSFMVFRVLSHHTPSFQSL